MGAVVGGKRVFDQDYIETNVYSVYENSFGGNFTSLKTILRFPTILTTIKRTISGTEHLYADYPGEGRQFSSPTDGCGYKYVLVRIRDDGKLDGVRQCGLWRGEFSQREYRWTLNKINLAHDLTSRKLLPTTPGDYLFICSFRNWTTKASAVESRFSSDRKYDIIQVNL